MAYATYTTRAIVCGTKDSYTSDRSYLLLTERAGMLWASARSVREEKSRQRYALQGFSLIRVSLVRGKTGWRIGSVAAEDNFYHRAPSRAERGLVTRIVKRNRQFVRGEEPQPALFADTLVALGAVVERPVEDGRAILQTYELRLLYHLGYIAPKPAFHSYLDSSDNWYQAPKPLPKEAEQAIAKAETASHL